MGGDTLPPPHHITHASGGVRVETPLKHTTHCSDTRGTARNPRRGPTWTGVSGHGDTPAFPALPVPARRPRGTLSFPFLPHPPADTRKESLGSRGATKGRTTRGWEVQVRRHSHRGSATRREAQAAHPSSCHAMCTAVDLMGNRCQCRDEAEARLGTAAAAAAAIRTHRNTRKTAIAVVSGTTTE